MAKSKIVKVNEKIAEKVVGTFEKIEEKAVGGYSKIEDAFVDRYLTKDSETVADAKERLKKEQEKREAEKAEISLTYTEAYKEHIPNIHSVPFVQNDNSITSI